MSQLNYHHLRYFWVIAQEKSLTKAAERLHVSQSALSVQLRQLEERLGNPLFKRVNRGLTLTEAGRITLDYAHTIFRTGDELLSALQADSRGRTSGAWTLKRQVLRVGSVATLSRNFQIDLLRPLLGRNDVELVLRSGSMRELLAQLGAHTIDVVLSNLAVPRDAEIQWHSHLLARQPVSLVARRVPGRSRKFKYPDDLRTTPVVLPSQQGDLRASFDLEMERAGIRPLVLAEVDDMAMLRLMARESPGVTLVPPIVVQDELRDKVLIERWRSPQWQENFYAITLTRRFPNSLLRAILKPD